MTRPVVDRMQGRVWGQMVSKWYVRSTPVLAPGWAARRRLPARMHTHGMLCCALQAAASGRPGAAYVDIPSNILMSELPSAADAAAAEAAVTGALRVPRPAPPAADVAAVVQLLRSAQRPLLVVGKGAALGRAEGPLRQLVEAAGLPFLATAMGRGVVPDDAPLCANAARSMALGQADVAVVCGARCARGGFAAI